MRHLHDRSTAPLSSPLPLDILDCTADADIDIEIDIDVDLGDEPAAPTDAARADQQSWSGVPTITTPPACPIVDRRRAYRHPVKLPVELIIDGKRHATTTSMLSLGGALIETALRPAWNARVELRFVVPVQGVTIEVGAFVRWSDARGFGVQFEGLRAHAVWALGKFFERL